MLTPKLKESRADALDIEAAPMAKAMTAVRNTFIFISNHKKHCVVIKRINLNKVDLMT